jgi:cell division cycle 2-like protein
MDHEDEQGWDGPNIRPPQASCADDRGQRQRSSGGGRRDRQVFVSGGRGNDRPPPKNLGHRRHQQDIRRQHTGGEDLRDRLLGRGGGTKTRRDNRDSKHSRLHSRQHRVSEDNHPKSREHSAQRDERDARLQRVMAATVSKADSRRDVEVRRQRRMMEKEAQEAEKRVKRKRDRSRDRHHEPKRPKDTSHDRLSPSPHESAQKEADGGEESGEGEEESDEESEEESESGEESSSEADTASEQSGATPERADDQESANEEDSREQQSGSVGGDNDDDEDEEEEEEGEQEEQQEEEDVSDESDSNMKIAEGKWRTDQKESPSRQHGGGSSRTPSRSPTPRRASDGEDSRLGDEGGSMDRLQPLSNKDGDLKIASGIDAGSAGDLEALKDEVVEVGRDVRDDLPPYLPSIYGCRSVEEFQCLNRIEEGTYGVVYRARDKKSNEIVALKRLKMEREKEGFPITSLREINTLLISQHRNVVHVREIVVGSNMEKIYIVMDFVQHDMKSLMETMREKKQILLPGEVKCLMLQLLSAIAHLHDNWILHRDLKTSNLLLSHNGILKVGDFGLAREYGSPLKQYTAIVVTLWYRAPELLLGIKEYSTFIDVWSIGCIFGEFLMMDPMFPAKSEIDQLNRIFKLLGTKIIFSILS